MMIVHTLKMCTGDAGPEQNWVLYEFYLVVNECTCEYKLHAVMQTKHYLCFNKPEFMV